MNKLNLRPGFTSVRDVTYGIDCYRVYCEILKGEGGPEYKCFTINESEEVLYSSQNLKPTPAVNGLLQILNIGTSRNWSGFEFFGFNRTDVINQLSWNPLTEEIQNLPKKIRGDANSYPELAKIAAIQFRNAGKIDELLHNKSKDARNEAIHNVVKLASKDDVQSIYSIYISLFLISYRMLSIDKFHLLIIFRPFI